MTISKQRMPCKIYFVILTRTREMCILLHKKGYLVFYFSIYNLQLLRLRCGRNIQGNCRASKFQDRTVLSTIEHQTTIHCFLEVCREHHSPSIFNSIDTNKLTSQRRPRLCWCSYSNTFNVFYRNV